MTKLLFVTDSHVRGTSPAGRTDNTFQTVLRKLQWVVDYAHEQGITTIIHGGDLFDSPGPSDDIAGSVGDITKQFRGTWVIVPGNHDLFGWQLKSLPYTKLGLVSRVANNVVILSRESGLYCVDDIEIAGQHYYAGIDHGNADDWHHGGHGTHRILIYHGQLLTDAPGFAMPHTLIKQVTTDAQLVLAGHYHPGWKTVQTATTTFCNPGSLLRNEASTNNIERMPKILLIETGTDQPFVVTEVLVACAQIGNTVMTTAHLQAAATQTDAVQSFKETLRSAMITTDETNLLMAVSGDIPAAIVAKATSALGALHDEREVTPKRTLQSIHLENFQSHIDTRIDFHPRLTAIVGESNAGKTSILRAIRWATQNEPRGARFIRTGAEQAAVTLQMVEGTEIIRTRTAASSGVLTVNGVEYKGFTRHLPPDLWSAHGMTAVEVNGISLIPSLALQHDPPFLLALSPGLRSLALAPLGGAERIEVAARQLGTEKTRISTQIRGLEGRHEQLTGQIAETDGAEARQTSLRYLLQLAEQAETMRQKLAVMIDFNRRWSENSCAIQAVEDRLARSCKLANLEQSAAVLRTELVRYQQISQLSHRWEAIDNETIALHKIMVVNPVPLIEQLQTQIVSYQQLHQYTTRLESIHTNITLQNETLAQTLSRITDLEAQEQLLIHEGAICPTCKKPL